MLNIFKVVNTQNLAILAYSHLNMKIKRLIIECFFFLVELLNGLTQKVSRRQCYFFLEDTVLMIE